MYIYVGKRGLYTLTSGVKVAYLSGLEKVDDGHNPTGDEKQIFFDKDDILSIRNSCVVSKTIASDYKGVDILLTSQWPCGIYEDHVSEVETFIHEQTFNYNFYVCKMYQFSFSVFNLM